MNMFRFKRRSTRFPDVYFLARPPSSCQQLKKHELHLDGGRWGRMLSRAQLFASLLTNHSRSHTPICALLSRMAQDQCEDDVIVLRQ